MNIQVIGTKKNSDTRKAERFFKERGIKFHFVDLRERSLSPGELDKIAQALGAENLMDSSGKEYKKKGFAYMEYDPLEEILDNPLLMKLPVIRNGSKCTIGIQEKEWQAWIDAAKL